MNAPKLGVTQKALSCREHSVDGKNGENQVQYNDRSQLGLQATCTLVVEAQIWKFASSFDVVAEINRVWHNVSLLDSVKIWKGDTLLAISKGNNDYENLDGNIIVSCNFSCAAQRNCESVVYFMDNIISSYNRGKLWSWLVEMEAMDWTSVLGFNCQSDYVVQLFFLRGILFRGANQKQATISNTGNMRDWWSNWLVWQGPHTSWCFG